MTGTLEAVGSAPGRRSGPSSGERDRRPPPFVDRRRARAKVLLVDDLDDQRELYREYLEFADYDVVVARDGYEAIDTALRVHPDVVVMDLAMPGLDGFETTQRLKRMEATRSIPVIALTAHGALPREWALSAGCDVYLKKPCYPHDLAVAIDAAVEGAHLPRPRAVSPAPAPLHARVLVAGGGVADRELFAEYLEYRGCAVSVAVEGEEVVRDARRHRPDVIVLDLDQTRRSGWEILRELDGDVTTRGIPVIALTRSAGGATRDEAKARGVVLLAKPCDPDTLYNEVGRATAGPRRQPD
jgi:two-component system, cell cycle response regulator DivK